MDFKIGDKVVYSCAAKTNALATVTNIDIARNAAADYIPWLTLSFVDDTGVTCTGRIAALANNLKMMQVRKPV